MSNQAVHVLLNPVSGGGRALRRWRRLEARAHALLHPLEVHASTHPGDLEAIAKSLRGSDAIVVAAGGDGTSHEVVNGLVGDGADPPRAVIAWLPIGSGNDLARSAGVPRGTEAALELIARRRARPIDVGRVSHGAGSARAVRILGNSLTVGLSGRVLDLVSGHRGRLRGNPAYGLAAARALLGGRPTALAVEADGRTVFDARTWLVSVTNGAYFGAGMLAAPGALVNDGRLHLVTVGGISRLRALALFPRIYCGWHLRHDAVTRWAIERVRITHDGPLRLELDGELVPAIPPIDIDLLPGAVGAVIGGPP